MPSVCIIQPLHFIYRSRNAKLDQSSPTKGQARKLNALEKSIGNDLGTMAFTKWLQSQTKEIDVNKDPISEKLKSALLSLENDNSIRIGNKGYSIKRARGKGASGFAVTKNT